MIGAEGIGYSYGAAAVLQDVALSAAAGEVVGLIGPNGSGKTTLLRTLYGSLRPQAGLVTLDDVPLADLSPRELAGRLSVVVQEGAGELPLTVADVVLLGRTPHLRSLQRLRPEDHRAAARALARVGVRDLADRTFSGLSGGEKQRVLIARALAQGATHLLLDEPTNHLDIRYQHQVLGLVRGIGVTTVVVLHDLNLAGRYCDRLVLLERGRVRAAGPTGEVLDPAVLEEVYGIGVTRHDVDGAVQLLFSPLPGAARATAPAPPPPRPLRSPA